MHARWSVWAYLSPKNPLACHAQMANSGRSHFGAVERGQSILGQTPDLGHNCRLHCGRLLCERFGQRGGHWGKTAAQRKEAKYATLQGTHLFQPVVVESLRTVEEAISSFLAELGHRISALSGDSREIVFVSTGFCSCAAI